MGRSERRLYPLLSATVSIFDRMISWCLVRDKSHVMYYYLSHFINSPDCGFFPLIFTDSL